MDLTHHHSTARKAVHVDVCCSPPEKLACYELTTGTEFRLRTSTIEDSVIDKAMLLEMSISTVDIMRYASYTEKNLAKSYLMQVTR